MSQSVVASLHEVRFPNESPAYRAARDRLLEAEIELRRQTEKVAAQRRALPAGGEVREDYVFEEDDARTVKLSQLFGDKDVLLLYSYMYGPKQERPCPSCTSILDGLDGEVGHISQSVAIAVVARSPIARILAFTKPRGWTRLRLLSAANNSYQRDYHAEDAEGSQLPIMNVFRRGEDGVIRHHWASELAFAPRDPGQDPRHVDAFWPLWAALDISPEGRGDFRPRLEYD
jgi:predicted dithiol-disulfide oxidoreductase (DUF899 family)